MISDQHSETSNNNVEAPVRGLTIEESFFLELLQKKEKPVINLKFKSKGAKVGTLEPFSNYYSESEIIRLLDSLVSKKALIKQEKGTVLLCPKCGGHANMAVLVCPRCGSTKIGRKEDLNHVECEHWGPREEFIDGVLLRCPRCDELLDERAIEGTSGYFSVSDPYFECQDCGTAVSKNNLTMVCIKCSNKYTTVQASYLNSVSYVLAQGVSVKPQAEPPKSIQQRMKEKYDPESIEEKEPATKPEPEPIPVREVVEEKPEKIESPIEKSSELEKEPVSEEEIVSVPKKIELDEPSEPESKASLLQDRLEPELVPEPEPELVTKPEPEPEQDLELEPIKPEKVEEPIPDEYDFEQELEPVPKKKKKKKKKKKSGLKNSMNRLSEMLKKKPKEKPKKKKKSIKKTSIKKKTRQEPIPEPEFELEKPEPIAQEPEEEYKVEPEAIVEEVEPVEQGFDLDEELLEPVEMEYEDKPIQRNSFYEEMPKPKVPEKNDSLQILMVVENVTVSEFVVESLERVKKPINVLHMEDGNMALKELKLKYDALIIDFELRSIETKFILSEMEKWGIMTPIIVLSDEDPKLDKYILNIEAILKKKQRSINKISGILRKLL